MRHQSDERSGDYHGIKTDNQHMTVTDQNKPHLLILYVHNCTLVCNVDTHPHGTEWCIPVWNIYAHTPNCTHMETMRHYSPPGEFTQGGASLSSQQLSFHQSERALSDVDATLERKRKGLWALWAKPKLNTQLPNNSVTWQSAQLELCGDLIRNNRKEVFIIADARTLTKTFYLPRQPPPERTK